MRHGDHIALNDPAMTRAKYGTYSVRPPSGRLLAAVILAVAGFILPPAIATAGSTNEKRALNGPSPYPPGHALKGRGRGYGFLPGYEPPEVAEWQRVRARRPTFWYGGPGFYRGRWNGGGFGPCWTPTPIGPHWNCG
jgi:hypothetical protein